MIPKDHPYTQESELLFRIPERAHVIELEIKRYVADTIDVPIEALDIDNPNQRIMYAEDMSWQRRRDAYDTAVLVHGRYRQLKEAQETQRQLNMTVGFDSLQHRFTPEALICLLRQQILNWQEMGEDESCITIHDLKAALERRFYQAYKGVKRTESYKVSEVVDLFQLTEMVDKAVRLDAVCDFEPKQWENFEWYGEFMQSITRIPQAE